MRYLDEGGVQQLDGDYIPSRTSLSGSNYFERESQIMHFVSFTVNEIFIHVVENSNSSELIF